MSDEQQIASEQGRARIVIDGQIVVGMSRPPGFQSQFASAEIDLHLVVYEHRRRDNPHFIDELVAEQSSKCLQVKRAACGHRPRQIFVADERRFGAEERRVPENVIGMYMRIYYITNWLWCDGADRREQPRSFSRAAAGVDDRDALGGDDEAQIGNVAFVG